MATQQRPRRAEWPGAVGRIVAFLALFVVLALALGGAYSLLGIGSGGALDLLATSVPAAAALIAGAVLLRAIDRRSPAALGIGASRATGRLCGLGLLLGMIGLTVAAVLLLAAGMLHYRSQPGTAAQWLGTVATQAGVFAVAALAEEAIFRGYAFQVLVRAAGVPIAVALSSVVFAWAHGANPGVGVFALVNIFLAGVLLAFAYLRTLSLWFVTALHMGWNWAMATLFDLPVSGIESFDTPLYQPAVSGPDWFSGGAFGPEGGLVGTIGFGVALVAVLRLRAVQPDPGVLHARPLVVREEAT